MPSGRNSASLAALWVRHVLNAYFLSYVSFCSVMVSWSGSVHTFAVSSVEQHEMLQHLIFEDELEARRRSDELLAIGLLDDIARTGVFGDLGHGGQPGAGGGASRGARRSRALGGRGGGDGGVCLLAGRHGGFVCLRMVSHVQYSASAITPLDTPVYRIKEGSARSQGLTRRCDRGC
jgi:hypothetical protein